MSGELLGQTVERFFAECEAGAGPPAIWPEEAWQQAEALGLAGLVAEHGAPWSDFGNMAVEAGRYAVIMPLCEAAAARALLAKAGLPAASGIAGLAFNADVTVANGRISGRASRVPWGRMLGTLVIALPDGAIAAVPLAQARVIPGANLAGEPRDTIEFDTVPVEAAIVSRSDLPETLGAALRAAQMAGAIERVLALALGHAEQRVQFGRPIGKFQAVQQNLAVLAGEAAAARAAARLAFATRDQDGDVAAATAIARIRAGRAAGIAAAIGHQVLGAMGFTAEHDLGRLTQRLLAWRSEFGTERAWATRLGVRALASGAEGLWSFVTSLRPGEDA